ncbi:N-acetylmuramoyl-L-alanine amidase [Enterococcus sp. AZ109]|uniref:N-acetylmuramoyl-L-alanine amidase n=1 Tax=Enterococcus sp. AZ109 TaxID=2774634 RepID=UPI003F24245B
MAYTVERRIRQSPQVGVPPYRQVHAHSTGNPRSTAQNEADYYHNKNMYLGTFSHIVGNGRVIQVGEVGRGFWDVGGGWNAEAYAAVEMIESHATRAEFERDYKIYCELLRDLAKQGGIPLTVDDGNLAGIKTHNYCTYHQPNNNSDHIDPNPYLAKWGISIAQFRKDVCEGTSTSNPGNNEKPELPQIEEEKNMFIYWKRSKNNNEVFDAFFVNGNKRFHLPNQTWVNEMREVIKRHSDPTWTADKEFRYNYDNFGVLGIEKTTEEIGW